MGPGRPRGSPTVSDQPRNVAGRGVDESVPAIGNRYGIGQAEGVSDAVRIRPTVVSSAFFVDLEQRDEA